MPDFPRDDLIRLEARTHCSRADCSVEAPCKVCVFTGLGLAENVPPTEANIATALAYAQEMYEAGKLTADEKAQETYRILRLVPLFPE